MARKSVMKCAGIVKSGKRKGQRKEGYAAGLPGRCPRKISKGRARRAAFGKSCGPLIEAAHKKAYARGVQEGFKRAAAGSGVAGLSGGRRGRRRRRRR